MNPVSFFCSFMFASKTGGANPILRQASHLLKRAVHERSSTRLPRRWWASRVLCGTVPTVLFGTHTHTQPLHETAIFAIFAWGSCQPLFVAIKCAVAMDIHTQIRHMGLGFPPCSLDHRDSSSEVNWKLLPLVSPTLDCDCETVLCLTLHIYRIHTLYHVGM